MLPLFDPQGGAALVLAPVLARTCAVAGLLWLFGSVVFRIVVLPRVVAVVAPGDAWRMELRQAACTWAGMAVGAAGLMGWLIVQSGAMAGATSGPALVAAVPVVALHTRFGHLILAQLAALAWVAALRVGSGSGWRRGLAVAGAAAALGLQGGHGHAASMQPGPSLLLAADVLHLAGAGAWLGGLLPLLLVVHDAPAKAGAVAARWFSPLGKLCIAAIVASSVAQAWVLVGSVAGLVGTAYGWVILLKLALLGVLLGFAAVNRYRLAPALQGCDPAQAKWVLVRSIAVQSGCGLAVVAAAALLGTLPPSMHVQAAWPFAWRISLAAAQDDADYRHEALGAALTLAGAAVLLGVAVLRRRRSGLLAGAVAMLTAGFALPHLSPLLVPAYPTSFYRSPTHFAATAIVAGEALYAAHCASCHGVAGRGDGPAGKALQLPPADLTASHLWMHSDGELFWWLAHGIAAPGGGQAMPGFARALTDDQRWAVIDFIRARNAGLAFAASGRWPMPLRAPELQARCSFGRDVSLSDLRGRFVRVVVAGATRVRPAAGVVTIVLGTRNGAGAERLCIADDAAAVRAYAMIAGTIPDLLAGTQFLIDGDGWMRAVQMPGPGAGWDDAATLAAALAGLRAQPPAASGDVAMPMNMKM